jgi:hypothetical protein
MLINVQNFIIKNSHSKQILKIRYGLMDYITIMMNSNKLTYEKPISVSLKLDGDMVIVTLTQGINPKYEYIGSIKML